MPKLYDIFESKQIAQYWQDINANMKDSYIGTRFFPVSKQTGLDLSWIKGYNGLPIALQPSAFDTKASLRDRIGVDKISTEMPFFREAMRIGEKDRQDIETFLAKGDKFAEPLILRIFDDQKNLIDGAIVQSERMAMSLLTDGKISIKASDDSGRTVAYDYNYDVNGDWKTDNYSELLTDDKWTKENKATNNPIHVLLEAKDKLQTKKGVTATEVIMNTKTFNDMMLSESLAKAMNPVGSGNVIISKKRMKEFLEDETELKITLYDKMYKDENGNDKKFYPDGYATLVPSYSLGNTWYGTTPEEFDLLNGETNASVSIVNTGIAVTTIKEPHPVNVQTIVSEIVLPSFERMNDIFVIKAF